jgi:pterin-4a-carbinolamine dehydratase
MADGLLAHLASRAVPGVNVVFLDTGYHFAETIGTRDWVSGVMPITLVNVLPEQTVAEQDAEYGAKLHDRDPDLCCSLRKVQPLAKALAGYSAWGSGVRRDESPTRAGTKVVDWDAKRGMVKVNPLAAWTQEHVDAYSPSTRCRSTRCRRSATPRSAAHRAPARWPPARTRAPALGRPRQDGVRPAPVRSRRQDDRRAPTTPPAPDELAAALSGLPLWSGDGEGIRRSVELPGFPDAVAALVRIAFVAEQLDHHPDVDLRWRTLHLTLVTHSAGGGHRAGPGARSPDRRAVPGLTGRAGPTSPVRYR